MIEISQALADLGIKVGVSVLSHIVEGYFAKSTSPSVEGLKKELVSSLNLTNAEVKADKLIEFLAENGNITISDTSIYAKDKIVMASSKGTSFTFGNDSISETKNTKIEARGNSSIVGKGKAKIVQDEDGSIRFYV